MKKRAGFTLIELLGVLVVIGLIGIVSFVTISNTVKRTSDKDYENFKENLYLSTETYIETNNVEINSEEVISTQTLISEGFIKDNIKNPKTNKSILNDSIKVTPNTDQNGNVEYSYSYIENGE
ncbi:MAG: type II secretion system protein [Bacilli bacterium]|nr:type II secretion system protein [Bacilli bacterium]